MCASATCVPLPGAVRRTSRISWAPSGWFVEYSIDAPATSFHFFTCPDDFYAVRLGFVNMNATSYTIIRAVAAPSSTPNDFANPTGGSSWIAFTFANGGADLDAVVSNVASPTEIIVAGAVPHAQGGSIIPRWTWTDWVPVASLHRTDRVGAPRVLMVRVLLPGGVTISQPNGGFEGYFNAPAVHCGFDYGAGWIPGDFVSSPESVVENSSAANFGIARATVACVQFLTKHRGLVGMATGDSHHQGTSTTTQFLNYLLRSTVTLGSKYIGEIPFGYVSTAAGGTTSE